MGSGAEGLGMGDAVSVVPAFAMTDYCMHGELAIPPTAAVGQALLDHPQVRKLAFTGSTSEAIRERLQASGA